MANDFVLDRKPKQPRAKRQPKTQSKQSKKTSSGRKDPREIRRSRQHTLTLLLHPVCCGPVTDLALIKTEKTLRPKKPKQLARRPIVTPSLPPKKPRYHPSPKAAAPNKPRRKLLRRAASTYPSWTTVLRRTARRAISARPVLIMRWTHCR